MYISEFEATPVYIVNSKIVGAMKRPCLKKKRKVPAPQVEGSDSASPADTVPSFRLHGSHLV